MNMKTMRLLSLICAILMIFACFTACELEDERTDDVKDTKVEEKTDAKTEETSAPDTESETEKLTEATTEAPTEEPTEEILDNVYTIVVVDENGAPVANVPVQVCLGDVCLIPVPTNADGIVEKTLDSDPSEYTVKIPDTRYVTEEYYTFSENSKVLTITVTLAD